LRWVKPKIMVEVSFVEWTRDGLLRHPEFVGVRTTSHREIKREEFRRLSYRHCCWTASTLHYVRLMENRSTHDAPQPGLQRDPDEWKTGDEPMTDAQRSYLRTLCEETGEEFDDRMTKAEASKRIDKLRARSPRLADEV
jgi:Protein of unknown function (DUF3072)/ATP dependent DNA ligase C terminal region